MKITANHIEQWSDSRESQSLLPVLIRRLIKETLAKDEIAEIDFPGYEQVSKPGFDGCFVSKKATAYIPLEKSVWEMGTNKIPAKKATADFKKREKAAKTNVTYVFVSSRQWDAKAKWVEDRADSKWKKVKVLDANDLEQWLDTCFCTRIWFAEQLGKPLDHLETTDHFLKDWLQATDPHFPKEILFDNRDEAKAHLMEIIDKPRSDIRVAADTREEAVAFICAILSEDGFANSPAVILNNEEAIVAFKSWQKSTDIPTILIAKSKEISRAIPTNVSDGNVLISAGVREDFPVDYQNSEQATNIIKLPRVSSFENIFKTRADINPRQLNGRYYPQTGGSLSALHRQLNSNIEKREPIWGKKLLKQNLIWLALVGRWDEAYDGDKEFLETLTDSDNYDDLRNSFLELSEGDDAPLEKTFGDKRGYRLFSRLDAFLSIAKRIDGVRHIDKFLHEAEKILNELDPNNKPDDKGDFSLITKKREYSKFLREGIVEGLIILNLKKDALDCDDITRKIEVFYNNIFAHDEAWISLNDVLPMLAEASPDDFMEQLRNALAAESSANKIRPLFEPRPAILHNDYKCFSLLWALEMLAWDAGRFHEIAMFLCCLQANFENLIQDNYGNRPSNSLHNIFRSWFPQTSASIEKRLEVLDALYEKHPSEAVRLAQALASSQDRTVYHTARLIWRDDALKVNRATPEESSKAIKSAINLLERHLADKEVSPEERFGIATYAVNEFNYWEEGYTKRFVEKIIEIFKQTDRQEVEELSSKFYKTLHHHLERSNISPPTEKHEKNIIKMMRKILKKTESDDLVFQNCRWFASLPKVDKAFKGERRHEKKQEYIDKKQAEAIQNIRDKMGIDGIIALTKKAENPAYVAIALYRYFISKESSFLWKYLIEFLKADMEIPRVQRHLSYIFGESKEQASIPDAMPAHAVIQLIKGIIKKLDNSAKNVPQWEEKKIALFHAIRIDEEKGRKFIDGLDETIQKKYFSRYRINHNMEVRRKKDSDPIPPANAWLAKKYRTYKRPRLGCNVLEFVPLPFNEHLELLEAVWTKEYDEGGIEDGMPDAWDIQQFLKKAYEENLDCKKKIRVAEVEFKFYTNLRFIEKNRISFVDWRIGKYSEYFVHLHKYSFKRDDNREDLDDDIPKDWDEGTKETYAMLAWNVLDEFNFGKRAFPWIKGDGQIDEDLLMNWIEKVKKLAKKAKRSEIVDHSIGKGLGYVMQEKGVNPPDSIRNILQQMEENEQIFSGFIAGRQSARGVTQGQEEEDDRGYKTTDLIDEYKKAARELREDGYPFVAKMMDTLSKSYQEYSDFSTSINERNNLNDR